MDLKTLTALKPLEVFEISNKLHNLIKNDTSITHFIEFAKNMEELRKKWLKSEERVKELECVINKFNLDKSTLQRQVNELKVDIEIHNEKRIKAENERDKLQKQIEMFKRILEDRQSYTLNDDDRNILLTATPGTAARMRQSLNRGIDETGSLISDYTEDDIDIMDDDNENHMIGAGGGGGGGQQIHQTKRRTHHRNVLQSPAVNDNNMQATSGQQLNRSMKRQKGSLSRLQEPAEKKRSRTRSQEPPQTHETHVSAGAAITAITTLKISEDGGPITVTSEIQSPAMSKQQIIDAKNNKLEVSFARPKTRKNKRPSREFLQRSMDDSESTDSETFWSSEAQAVCNAQKNLLTPIVETPLKLSKENLKQFNQQQQMHQQQTTQHAKKVNSTPNIPSVPRKPLKKTHAFKSQILIGSEMCVHCDKRTRFGKMVLKCVECGIVVHPDCKEHLDRPCYLPVIFPQSGTITDYSPHESPRVPSFIQFIIPEIEKRGLGKEIGLYRVNGSDVQMKQIREKLLKRHQLPDLRKINDVHVLCSFVKDFLKNLTEPLITFDLWFRFAKACEIENDDDRLLHLESVILDLPLANRDTLAYMMLHLQRINASPECKMHSLNLSYVFGPSIIGNSAINVTPAQIVNELKIQHQLIECMIAIPSEFFENILNVNDQKLIKNAPLTPDILRKSRTATVLSSLLGPAINNTPTNSNKQQQQLTNTLTKSTLKHQHHQTDSKKTGYN